MPENDRTAASEILRVIESNLENNPKFIVAGLGVNDPKGIFGTTKGLSEKYGPKRVLETPTSENAMTGVGVGLALSGFRPLLVHQRMDFFLLAMDQLVNSAAKWHYMFGQQNSVPITIRLITGRGWGQGPTHSQNLHSWFAHIPGLKIVMPAFAADVAPLLQSAIDDPNPVIFIEDRWIHNQKISTEIDELNVTVPLGKAKIVKTGSQITIVASGYLTIEALKATEYLRGVGISVELVDLRSIKPLDIKTIDESVKKTGALLVVDAGHETASFGNEIISRIATSNLAALKREPKLLALPDVPEPTSYGVIGEYRISAIKIAEQVLKILGAEIPKDMDSTLKAAFDDVPDSNFTGPF
jgi:pyruvate dehydrogenase E1 component beta subunit